MRAEDNLQGLLGRTSLVVSVVVSLLFCSPAELMAQLVRKGTPPPVGVAQQTAGFIAVPAAINPSNAQDLAQAMGIPAGDIVSATIGTTDPAAVGVGASPLGKYFPTDGDTFAILATGLAASAELPNNEDDLSTELAGLNNSQGNDMAQLRVELSPPAGATCLAFDFAFYSEEFPEWVGSQFNDAFIAEIGGSDFTIINDQVVAPLNFAFDTTGNAINVNTVFGVTPNTESTYDGVTPLLRAVTPLEPSHFPTTELVFTITDLGDSVWDSAVLLDRFSWLFDTDCQEGADADSDGDALLDRWETNGLDVDGDGTIDLDLPAMGADPQHKDVFVEIDYMVEEETCQFGFCFGGHSHQPKPEALQIVIDAFHNAPVANPDGTDGINIHIDSGPDSIMNPVSGATWGDASRSEALAHDNGLGAIVGGQYDWSEFDTIKGVGSTPGHFAVVRRDVFHYVIFAHDLGGLGSVSGISRGISASDLIVSLGEWTNKVGTVNEQGGTLMHELGHNLSLRHGGDDDFNYKPNYLSLMNYFYQMRGLRLGGADGHFDYSSTAAATLDESQLDEPLGIVGLIPSAGARYFCNSAQQIINTAADPIDWNCDGDATDLNVAEDVNNGAGTTLTGYNDWAHIRFDGGAVGKLGQNIELPAMTEANEISQEEDALIPTPFAMSIDGPGALVVLPGSNLVYQYTLTNEGTNADVYDLSSVATQPWADLSGVPSQVALNPGASMLINIPVEIPAGVPAGSQDSLHIEAFSQAQAGLADSLTTETTVNVDDGGMVCDLDGDNDVDLDDIQAILAIRGQTVPPADPSADADGNGVINVLDARLCVLECSNARCAP
jgi:hypothetical protein